MRYDVEDFANVDDVDDLFGMMRKKVRERRKER